MQTCKWILIYIITTSFCFSQNSVPTIQAPIAPSIHTPAVTAPTIPTLQMSTIPNNATVKTTSSTTANNEKAAPANLSTELTTTALETLNGIFSSDTADISALEEIGSFSSLGDLSSLLTEEIASTDDTTTLALLQEILIKLTELESKIDALEATNTQNEGQKNEQ